jgi:hypothetical protein
VKIVVVPQTHSALLSPPSCIHHRRRSSVMFSDVILLHGGSVNTLPGSIGMAAGERNVCSSEKMTQTGDGNVWSPPQPNNVQVCSTLLTLSFWEPAFFNFTHMAMHKCARVDAQHVSSSVMSAPLLTLLLLLMVDTDASATQNFIVLILFIPLIPVIPVIPLIPLILLILLIPLILLFFTIKNLEPNKLIASSTVIQIQFLFHKCANMKGLMNENIFFHCF